VPPGLTEVSILDYDFVHFINFEAEINYPEEDGIVQVENFGMHLSVDGTIIYGVYVDAILERQHDDISLDHLSRLLVDVHQDSSQIMNDLLSQYQRNLLDMIFMGDTDMRNKFNCIVADTITPKLPAEDYLDKEDNENELKQVLGDIRSAHDLSDDDVILLGQDGVLLVGPNAAKQLELLVSYVGLLCRELFIRNYFVRTFVLNDSLKKIRNLIMKYQKDPNNIQRIRSMINDASRDIILLREVLLYLKESLDEYKVPKEPGDRNVSGQRLYKVLGPETMQRDIILRCNDLVKLIDGAHNQLRTLQQMTDVINSKQLEDVFKSVEANTKFLVDASAANERSSASLEVMQVRFRATAIGIVAVTTTVPSS
jgi:WD repeat-containing protein 35